MIGTPPCATWAEHEWSAARFLGTGYHTVNGHYSEHARTCVRLRTTDR